MKICLDSRLIKPGEYFVPIVGENFDGHKYIQSAMQNGAKGVLEEKELYNLVQNKLSKINPIIIGVTGSSGKSTTTKMLYEVLSKKFNCCLGSLNTKIGLSVNVINEMHNDCKIFVAEIGMDKLGEIKDTTKLFQPDYAVITTINHVHVEKLGSMKNLVQAKGEILQGLKTNGTAIINSENKYTKQLGKKHKGKLIWFDSTPLLKYPTFFKDEFNIRNANVCTIIARQLGMSDEQILEGLNRFKLPKGRLNIISGFNDSTIIDDTYNANPESVKFALDILNREQKKRKIAILGDMRELGRYSKKDHKLMAEHINLLNIDVLVGVGNLAKIICTNTNALKTQIYWIDDSDKFNELIDKKVLKIDKDTVILIKGSQGQRMEKIVKLLMKYPDQAKDLLVRQDARWS